MPVPRLFEASSEPREQWVHVLATLLGTRRPGDAHRAGGGDLGRGAPERRRDAGAGAAAPAGRTGRARGRHRRARRGLDPRGAGDAGLRRRRGGPAHRDPRRPGGLEGPAASSSPLTPDRKAPPAVERAVEGGRDVRHRSWLRLRDWVQERPERGRAAGHRPAAAAGGRVLPHAPRRRALPPRGAHAPGRGRAATEPGRDVLRPQRAGAGAADPERGPARRGWPSRAPATRRPRSPSTGAASR